MDKTQVDSLHAQGVRTCHIMGFIMGGPMGGHEGLGFHKKYLFNHIERQRRAKIKDEDVLVSLSYLEGKADNDPMFYARYVLSKNAYENVKNSNFLQDFKKVLYGVNSCIKSYPWRKNSIIKVLYNFEHSLKDFRTCSKYVLPMLEQHSMKAFSRGFYNLVKDQILVAGSLNAIKKIGNHDKVIFKVDLFG
ncbi:hypothetical protein D0Y65_039072 [Glycine soja]|uniref:Uncharacterized protein n=1 Tax=Glycine soja TaxID=3848 RepID=A0A445H7Z1_GLYSO|nr:hypothetical protein D0Y65_039072 [Glycine soja]